MMSKCCEIAQYVKKSKKSFLKILLVTVTWSDVIPNDLGQWKNLHFYILTFLNQQKF